MLDYYQSSIATAMIVEMGFSDTSDMHEYNRISLSNAQLVSSNARASTL